MTIAELQQAAYDNAKAKGFHEGAVDIDQKLLLAVGELVEAQNELREGFEPQQTHFYDKMMNRRLIPLTVRGRYEVFEADPTLKPEGFGIELADAVIRIADLAALTDIDLQRCIAPKMKYNATRPHKHGGKAF